MNERTFQFRLRSSHAAPDRATQDLVVEFLGGLPPFLWTVFRELLLH